jgi:serpin B
VLHPAFNALDLELASRGGDPGLFRSGDFELNIANAIWGQSGYAFWPDYLDTLARHYDSGVYLVDFQGNPAQVVDNINAWASDNTEGLISQALAPGSITDITRLALTNVIYFYGRWEHPFSVEDTRDDSFYLLDDTEIAVPTMHQEDLPVRCVAEGEGYQAVELPYQGEELAMLIILPDRGHFNAIEDTLDAGQLERIMNDLSHCDVILSMPRFEFESDINLADALTAMGMPAAFSDEADFSGMADLTIDPYIFIETVAHQALIRVDEEGTEAAAFTFVGFGAGSAGPPQIVEIRVDHPFIFVIYDSATNTILFVGRVLDPR